MSFTVRCGSDVPWYSTEGDCGARDVCGRGVALCDKMLREDYWGGGVGSGSCGGGGGRSMDASDTTGFIWLGVF